MATGFVSRLKGTSEDERQAAPARTSECISPEEADAMEQAIEDGGARIDGRRLTASFVRPAIWWHHRVMPKAPVEPGFSLAIEYFREEDGRWLADIPALPGVTSYGRTKKQATVAVQALALRLIADRLEHGEAVPGPMNVSFIAA